MEIIIKLIFIYLGISTFILFNLLFNPRVNIWLENTETGEREEPPSLTYIIISLSWIILFPYMLLKGKKE